MSPISSTCIQCILTLAEPAQWTLSNNYNNKRALTDALSTTSPAAANLHLDALQHITNGSPGFERNRSPTLSFHQEGEIPYSVVSSFNPPVVVDTSLLTPVSTSRSPPMHPRVDEYQFFKHEEDDEQEHQQPTPPQTSNAHYYPYETTSSSSTQAPLMVQTPVMASTAYSLPSHYVPQSNHRDAVLPPQHQPFLGSYAVSQVSTPGESGVSSEHQYPTYAMEPYNNSHHIRANFAGTGISPALPALPGLGPTTYDPSNFAAHHSHMRPDAILPAPGKIHIGSSTTQSSGKARGSGVSKRTSGSRRSPSQTSASRYIESAVRGAVGTSMAAAYGSSSEPFVLSDNAPADDGRLFQLRQQLHDSKGKRMWDRIVEEYGRTLSPEERASKSVKKAALQMKLQRAVLKHGVWPQHEVELLHRAWNEFERQRYVIIRNLMKDMGGCRVWDWRTTHIEAQLVREGLESPQLQPDGRTRRRRYVAPLHPRTSSDDTHSDSTTAFPSRGGPNGPAFPRAAGSMVHMNTQSILPPPYTNQQRRASHDMWSGCSSEGASALTHEQEEQLVEQVFQRQETDMEDSPEP